MLAVSLLARFWVFAGVTFFRAIVYSAERGQQKCLSWEECCQSSRRFCQKSDVRDVSVGTSPRRMHFPRRRIPASIPADAMPAHFSGRFSNYHEIPFPTYRSYGSWTDAHHRIKTLPSMRKLREIENNKGTPKMVEWILDMVRFDNANKWWSGVEWIWSVMAW